MNNKHNTRLGITAIIIIFIFGSFTIHPPVLSDNPLTTLWKYDLGKNVKVPQLVLVNGTIIFGNDAGKLICLDEKAGKKKWEFQADGPIYEKPIERDNILYFGSYKGTFYAVFADKGKIKWKTPIGEGFKCVPSIHNNLIYITYKKSLIALDVQTGLNYKQRDCLLSGYQNSAYTDSLLLTADKISINAYKFTQCNKIWSYQLKSFGMSEPLVYNDILFIMNADGIFGINTASGKNIWKIDYENKEIPQVYSTYLEDEDTVGYASVLTDMYAIRILSGKILWKYKSKSKTDLGPAIKKNNSVYFSDNESNIFCINNNEYKKVITYHINDNKIKSPLYKSDNLLLFINPEGFLCAVKLDTKN